MRMLRFSDTGRVRDKKDPILNRICPSLICIKTSENPCRLIAPKSSAQNLGQRHDQRLVFLLAADGDAQAVR